MAEFNNDTLYVSRIPDVMKKARGPCTSQGPLNTTVWYLFLNSQTKLRTSAFVMVFVKKSLEEISELPELYFNTCSCLL